MFSGMQKIDRITALVMLLALVSIVLMPFQDTSEPRYAEIARLMYSTGDWITPWFEPGKPFWGKPPFSFWAAAASMHVFGVNEFAARFPSWLSMLISLMVIRYSLARVYGSERAQWTALIYVSMVLVFINVGAVLTDPFLALGTSLVFCSFIMCMHAEQCKDKARTTNQVNTNQNNFNSSELDKAYGNLILSSREQGFWAYLGFIGLAIGLLAKGPLTLVLVGGPIAVYLAWHKARWQQFMRAYPWFFGIILVTTLVLPWYILAELKTPGFLNYFIVGEHFLRFVDPGWQGDLYGTAHQQVYGTIWLNALVASLPWWPMVLIIILLSWKKGFSTTLKHIFKSMPMVSFVVSWALFCGAFFTFSGNILWTYLLPSMIAMALVFAHLINSLPARQWYQRVPYLALLAPTLMVVAVCVGMINPNIWKTEKYLVSFVQEQGKSNLYYYKDLPFSARFYSTDTVQNLDEEALSYLQSHQDKTWFIAVSKNAVDEFKEQQVENLQLVFENKRYYLFKHIASVGGA